MLRYGILSTSSIVERVLNAINMVKDSEVLAIASRDLFKAKDFAEKHHIKRYYGSYDTLLEDKDVDIVYIPLINTLHYEYAKKAILKKKHVILEKPFTLKGYEARELFDLAKKNQVFLMESMKTTFMPIIRTAKKLIEEGAIGDIKYVRFERGSINAFNEGHWMLDGKEGGGAFLGNGPYVLAIVYYLFGTIDQNAVFKVVENEKGADMLLSFLMKIKDIIINSTVTLNVEVNDEMVIYGEKGKIVVPNHWRPKKLFLYDREKLIDTYEDNNVNEFIYEFTYIKKCIDKGMLVSNVITPKQTIEICELMERIKEV